MTEPLFSSSAPVFKVDGEVVGSLARDLSSLAIEEATDGLKTLVLRLVATGPRGAAKEEPLLYLDGDVLDFGKALTVSIGPADGQRVVFDGKVSALEAAFRAGAEPHVVVYAEDAFMSLRMTRRMKTYESVTDADVATAIANEHGLTPDVDADGPTYDVVQQWNQSDLAFLRERARLVQAEAWVEEGRLCFKARTARSATELTLVQGNELLDVALRADLAHQRTAVRVSGYDASLRDVVDEEAGPDAVQAEIASGTTGASILSRAFGERSSYRVRQVPLVAEEARAWAKAEMLRRARGFVTVSGTTSGTPDLVVGSRVTLDRVGPPFSGGGYTVTRVRHTYDLSDGHRTRFEAERATISSSGAAA